MAPELGTPQGDMGLGLCHACTTAYKAAPDKLAFPPFAITMQPTMCPLPGGMVVIPLPVCYEHVAAATPEQMQSQTRRPLLVAGAMP